jgi:hypothetical protein
MRKIIWSWWGATAATTENPSEILWGSTEVLMGDTSVTFND